MADDPKKVKEDRNLIAFKQKWEVDFAVKQLAKLAEATKKASKEALFEAAREISPSEGRKKIMKAALKKLKG
ncbi:MAG: hypothetical protein QOE22_691 [Candidatus Parcubacteria bacterium]|jgi:hypothetical protein|nr:hypothetical protein [Candidatus Parcubacteria bacterium]